jgi:helix-turn-helix protein
MSNKTNNLSNQYHNQDITNARLSSVTEYLSVKQVSEYLSLTKHTIYKYCSERKIPYRKLYTPPQN